MRLGFDLRPFLKEETGVGIYYRNLLFELAQIDRENEYFLFSSSLKDDFPQEKVPPFARGHFRHFRFPVKAVNFFWYELGWPRLDIFFQQELDLTHSPTPLPLPTMGKKIITIHDLFFVDFPQRANRDARVHFQKKIKKALQEADGIITVSHFSKKAILERFPVEEKKIEVIHLGLSSRYLEEISLFEIETIKRKYHLFSPFILFVGAFESRKNLPHLVEAFARVREKDKELHLVLVGREGGDSENIRQAMARYGLESSIKILGYIPENDLRCLYRAAKAFVFPSYCEGFGIPLLEAMASSLPIAASRASSIPEVARDAALYFEPEDTEDMAEKVVLILKDEKLRQELVARGKKRASDFHWRTTALRTLSFYYQLLGK